MRAYLISVLTGLLAVSGVSTAQGQGIARSFDQLHLLVRPGETIIVRDITGTEVKGRLDSLTAAALVVRQEVPREFTEDQVSLIKANRGDSLRNGALIGFGIGAGLATAALGAFCGGMDSDCTAAALLMIPVYGGIGAGIGVGFDALITRPQVVYQREFRRTAVGVGPMFAPARGLTGAAVTVGF